MTRSSTKEEKKGSIFVGGRQVRLLSLEKRGKVFFPRSPSREKAKGNAEARKRAAEADRKAK
jgi:hypothetical protein